MRSCAKMRCGNEPMATVSLVYTERQVVVVDLIPERDPNLLDLCDEHVGRMTLEAMRNFLERANIIGDVLAFIPVAARRGIDERAFFKA